MYSLSDLNPKISVIIPVLNDREHLQQTLLALSEQTYPIKNLEIIVVDNGSDETLESFIEEFNIKLLKEVQNKSPYAARNKGLEIATGSVIALTDANKTPHKNWIEEGVKSLITEDADLVGGNIIYDLPENYTASERFDSLYFNNNRNLVLNEGSVVTGNLFFKKELLESIGYFPGQFRSGMDIWWSQKAVSLGYKLVFSEKATVVCKPRRYNDLIKKSFRVGKSHPFIFKKAGESYFQITDKIIRTFFPPKFQWIQNKGLMSESLWFRLKIWFVAWSYKVYMGCGRVYGILFLRENE